MIPDGYTDLPPGKLAAVVTYLEMKEFGPAPEHSAPNGFSIRRVDNADASWYRRLFRQVGEPWLWFGRLRLSDQELQATLWHPMVDVYALEKAGEDVGLLELDRREPGEMELAYLGVSDEVVGSGAGRFLMQFAIAQAVQHHVHRFWLHTCSFDHPAALRFYRKAGFRPYKFALEVFDDPRLTGDLPRGAAPHVPLIEP